MYMLRETGSKGESGAAEAVITALFGAADDQQDGTLQENELVTFMRMYKYYCYTFTTTKGPVEGEERLVSDRAFRTEVLDPLMRQVTQNKLPTTTEKHEERGVDEAAITIHRVEHLPETAGEDEQFEAMVVAYQRDFKWKDIDATAYADARAYARQRMPFGESRILLTWSRVFVSQRKITASRLEDATKWWVGTSTTSVTTPWCPVSAPYLRAGGTGTCRAGTEHGARGRR